MDKQCGIYVIQNLINDKYYVGQAQDIVARWKCEKWALNQEKPAWNKHLQRAWKKYGEDNFKFEVIEICDIDMLFRKKQEISFARQQLVDKCLQKLEQNLALYILVQYSQMSVGLRLVKPIEKGYIPMNKKSKIRCLKKLENRCFV